MLTRQGRPCKEKSNLTIYGRWCYVHAQIAVWRGSCRVATLLDGSLQHLLPNLGATDVARSSTPTKTTARIVAKRMMYSCTKNLSHCVERHSNIHFENAEKLTREMSPFFLCSASIVWTTHTAKIAERTF